MTGARWCCVTPVSGVAAVPLALDRVDRRLHRSAARGHASGGSGRCSRFSSRRRSSSRGSRWQRERRSASAPPQLAKRKLRERHPQLDGRDADLVERGFRQFFIACLRSERKFVAMPSRKPSTRSGTSSSCTRASTPSGELTLGRFLHHTPAEALGARAERQRRPAPRLVLRAARRNRSIRARPSPAAPVRARPLSSDRRRLRLRDRLRRHPEEEREPVVTAGSAVYCGASFSDGSVPAGDADASWGASTRRRMAADGGDGGCGGGGAERAAVAGCSRCPAALCARSARAAGYYLRRRLQPRQRRARPAESSPAFA